MYNVIIAYLLIKEYYEKYRQFINIPYTQVEFTVILKAVDTLMGVATINISVDELELFLMNQPYIKEKEKQLYSVILDNIRKIDTNEKLSKETLNTIRTRGMATTLADCAIQVAQGQKSLEDLHNIYSQFDNIQHNTNEDPFVTDNLQTLYEETTASPGLRWKLQTLNRMLGSLRKGDFGFLFARPETGKTTFLANEATNFARQSLSPILWCNNEEQGNKVQIRCFQAALGVTTNELMQDRATNQLRYLEITRGNLRILDSASIHKRQVEELCKRLTPGLILFDQIDKIKGFDADREDLRLGSIYIWARELAKQYCPVIGVCQAAGTAEGKKWLNMDDVANAKTAKQSEADFIIGIGRSHDIDLEYIRHINICKNKLTGDPDSIPSLRHGKADVRIFPEIAQYKDLI